MLSLSALLLDPVSCLARGDKRDTEKQVQAAGFNFMVRTRQQHILGRLLLIHLQVTFIEINKFD